MIAQGIEYVVGIDPGVSGAVVFLRDGFLLGLKDFPSGGAEWELASYLENFMALAGGGLLVIEKVGAMPAGRVQGGEYIQQGAASASVFLQNIGWWRGVFDVLLPRAPEWSVERVAPQKWQAGLPKKEGRNDKPSWRYCQRFYPAPEFKFKKDHNRTDAFLIAKWGYERSIDPLFRFSPMD